MTKRISELPVAGGVADTDEFEINQAGVSRKATRGQIVAGLASAAHEHDLADIADTGALAALDTVGSAEIDAAAYASQSEAVAGADSIKLMSALRTAEAIAARAAAPEHEHALADITDAGALAALDAIRPTEIDPSAYATQSDAAEGLDGTRIMTAGRTAEAIAAQAAAPEHEHALADITDAGALAALNMIGTAEIAASAYASQSDAVAGTDNSKIMTALRTAEAIAAQPAGEHQHDLADITDAGALAALDSVGTAEIKAAAYASHSDAVAGIDEAKIMTALRTAEAIAAQAAAPQHQHDLADIADAGALAALNVVGSAEIAASAYASQSDAVAGTDDSKIMTALRTAQAIAAHPAGEHQHEIADITDAGALAALDAVGTAEIKATAYASQSDAVAGTDDVKIMTALRTADAIAAQAAAPEHQHDLADIADAGALAGLDAIRPTEIDASAYATQIDAAAGVDGTRIMTAERTAEAIAAHAAPQDHHHSSADITDLGALAALNVIGADQIAPNAVTSSKILGSAVTTFKLADAAITQDKIADSAVSADKIAADAVITSKLADAAVTHEKIADGAIGANQLQPGIPINMQDAVLRAAELRDYAETSPAPEVSSGTLTLDLETGNVFEVILTEDVTSVVLANPPAHGRAGSCSIILRQDATGGRSLSWPSSVKWPDGTPPPITSAADAVDIHALITRDGGETWFGFPGGQDFS
jgi:trimeric autotransporter adhesin